MADKSSEKAQQTAREAADTASEAVGKAADTARRTSEAATNGYEELLTLSRHNMEGLATASQAMLKGASDLGSLWASFWNEQLTTGVEAMRSLAESDSWDQALKVQNEFARSSLDRVCSRAVKSTEVTAEMVTSSLVPLQESARRASAHAPAGGVVLRTGIAVQWSWKPRADAGLLSWSMSSRTPASRFGVRTPGSPESLRTVPILLLRVANSPRSACRISPSGVAAHVSCAAAETDGQCGASLRDLGRPLPHRRAEIGSGHGERRSCEGFRMPCEGFRMPAGRNVASSTEGRRRKAAREGTRGGRARRWGLWGFDGCRRSGAAQGTGLMAARERLVGGGMATGVAQRTVLRAQADRCRCDRRSGA